MVWTTAFPPICKHPTTTNFGENFKWLSSSLNRILIPDECFYVGKSESFFKRFFFFYGWERQMESFPSHSPSTIRLHQMRMLSFHFSKVLYKFYGERVSKRFLVLQQMVFHTFPIVNPLEYHPRTFELTSIHKNVVLFSLIYASDPE